MSYDMGMNHNACLVCFRCTYVGMNVDTTLDTLQYYIKTADLLGSNVNRQGSLGLGIIYDKSKYMNLNKNIIIEITWF